jgi:hypothetical protein
MKETLNSLSFILSGDTAAADKIQSSFPILVSGWGGLAG